MSLTEMVRLARSWSVRKAVLALSVSLGMAALFLFAGVGLPWPAPSAHAALSPPDARPDAPAAKLGKGPFTPDDKMHCHHGKDFDPPRPSAGGHTHNDFHSGFRRDTPYPNSDYKTYAEKYESYFEQFPDDVFWSNGISSFRQGWKPPDQPDWHNHGDDDTHWWTPDADNGNTCLFSPEFPQDTYTREVAENTLPGKPIEEPLHAYDEDGDEPTYTLEGTDRASFSIGSFSGQLATKAKLDYETRSSYSVVVRASDPAGGSDTAAVTIKVTDVEEPGVVALSPAQPRVGVALTATLTDGDGDVTDITWQWARSDSQGGTYTNIDGATSASYTPVAADDENKYLQAKASYTDRLGSGNNASKVSDNAVQAAPYFSSATADRSVDENTQSGQDIGDPVEVANAHGTFTYTLSGTDARSFSIVRETGQLKARAALNYETKSSYTVRVTARDAASKTATVTVTINVTNVDEDGVVTLSSRQPRVGAALTASLTDPDVVSGTPTWQWAHSATQSGSYTDIASATSASYTPVSDDVGKYLRATASYNDGHGTGKSVKEETANAVNDRLGITGDPSFTRPENGGHEVHTFTTNASGGSTVRWSLVAGADRGDFSISSAGVLRFRRMPNFEAPADAGGNNEYLVTVRASASGETADKAVTVTVTNVDEDGTVTLSAQQPRVGTALTARLTDPDGNITGTTWQWASANSPTGQFRNISEATSASYTPKANDVDKYLWATASYNDGYNTDPNAKTSAQGVTAKAVQGAPVFASQTATRSIAENTSPGHSIGNPVSATDSDTLTYSLGGADARSFGIARSTGQLQTKAPLNYETRHSYTVTVTATDTSRLSASITVNITVTNVDEDGAVALSTQQPLAGTGLTATLSDPDKSISGVSWRWSRANSKGGTYTGISGATFASYTPAAGDVGKYLRVTATYTDGHGPNKTAEKELANAVRETNRAPSFPSGTNSRSVAENTGAGTNIGNPVRATDPNSDTLTYSLAGSDARAFRIDTATGQLKTKAALNYESKSRYTLTVRATDTARATATTTVTINVTDVEEDGSVRLSSQQPRVGTRMTATLTDPDGQVSDVSWQWRSSNTKTGTFAPVPGAATSSYTPVGGDQGKYLKAIASYTDRRGPDKSASAVAASAVRAATINNPPVFGSNAAATESIAENTPANTNIGNPVRATDQDTGDTLTYTLEGTDSAYFAISPATGRLRTGAVLDYENPRDAGANNVYDVTVRVSDGVDTATKGVTITVTDVDEPGVVTLSSSHPRVGQELTATLRDPDGTTSGVTWSWHSSADRSAWSVISGETSDSYTPVAADVGKYLQATASYSDSHGSKTEWAVSVNPVQTAAANRPPVFSGGTPATRSIAENTPAGQNIGDPVRATDRDTGDRLTYALSGTDAASFVIVASSGQLRTKAALDYERKRNYSVTVTVTDTAGASDTIAVTINVTNIEIPGKPGTPTVTAASASGHSALWARWTAPGASAVIDGYNVQYRAVTSGNWYSARSASGTSATVSGLVSDTAYQVRVRAHNSEGRSGWSNPGQGRTDAAPAQQQRTLRQPTRTPAVCTPAIGFRTGVPWSFTAARGGDDPPDVFLEVWNRDLCGMDFRVSSSARWLSISPASGRSEGAHQEKQITLSADISGLDVGTHTAAIRITAPKSGNSPQSVSVSLTITRPAPPESNYCQERTVIESSDSAFRVVVPANSAPCETGIKVESLDADSQQTPVGEGAGVVGKVVRAGQVSAASADTRINAALWALLPGDRVSACEDAAEAAVYRVVDGDSWDLLTQRCEMDEQGRVWLVLPLTGFGVYAVTLPAPSAESGITGEVQAEARLQTPEAAETDTAPGTPSPETMASNGPASSINAVESQPTPTPKPEVVQVELQPTPAPGPDVVHADASAAGLWADLPPEELALPVVETGQSPPRRLGSLGILLYILAPVILIIALLLIMFGVRNLRGAESATP